MFSHAGDLDAMETDQPTSDTTTTYHDGEGSEYVCVWGGGGGGGGVGVVQIVLS